MRTMATGVHQRTYLDSWIARVVALGVALAMFALIFVTFGEAIGGAIGVRDETAGQDLDPTIDPRLAACIQRRTAALDADRADGVLTQRQFDDFRARVSELCEAQNRL